ncbi:uncharacterized protein CLAFUR5_04923 [Fulvia fulva]|uniref:Ubiquitin-like domain-containing protein n=1 Tax=Passalora fulva TaxID=5499 RepID=A0A9Q8LFS2_PASFU|nr:uncharacterized protein CLAFUR5_04923 [Fulvia fulva]UJO15833.1 hypothetical protein CLAFUR5_04923 [Fulvia fulva]
MSQMWFNINIPVTLTLDLVEYVKHQAHSGGPIDHDAIRTALADNIDAITDTILAIPYDIRRRNSVSASPRPSETPSSFRIFVKTPEGLPIVYQVTKYTTVTGLTEKVQGKEGLRPQDQRLVLNGKVIFNGAREDEDIIMHQVTIGAVGIKKDTLVILLDAVPET